MAPTPVLLPGESHGQRSLVGYSPWGCKKSDMTGHACMQHERSYEENGKFTQDTDKYVLFIRNKIIQSQKKVINAPLGHVV